MNQRLVLADAEAFLEPLGALFTEVLGNSNGSPHALSLQNNCSFLVVVYFSYPPNDLLDNDSTVQIPRSEEIFFQFLLIGFLILSKLFNKVHPV
jgi:hypothetical protein